MATIKLKLDKSYKKKGMKDSDMSYPLVISVSHRRKGKNIQTGFHLKEGQWDDEGKKVKRNFENSKHANTKVAKYWAAANEVISLPKQKLKELDVYNVVQIIELKINKGLDEALELLKDEVDEVTKKTKVKDYTELIVERLKKAKRFNTARIRKDTWSALFKFCGNENLLFTDITPLFLEDMEANWLGKGNELGGLSVHLRSLRKVFNTAIEDKNTEVIAEHYPFGGRGYKIKEVGSVKRAIKLSYIQKMRERDYTQDTPLWHHRNYFLLMFNLRGMNFKDLSELKIENLDLEDGRCRYKRSKTKYSSNSKEFNIKLSNEAKTILNYYIKDKGPKDLVLPIMEGLENEGPEFVSNLYNSKREQHNRFLNKIQKDIGLNVKLTTYVARHTFATALLFEGVNKFQIGSMLGHKDARTTERYFAEFDVSVQDEAADLILC